MSLYRLFKSLLSDQNRIIAELEHTQSILENNSQRDNRRTIASLAFSLLGDLIDECVNDVLLDIHRDIKRATSVCQICQTRCKQYIQRPGCDVWGKSYNVNNLPSYECVNCKKTIASTRYAPHLEKCLGLSGRQSSRVASRRIGTLSDDSQSPQSIYSTQSSDRSPKKKKPNGMYLNGGGGVSRIKKLKYT
ncbi:hypothetical protein BDB01DRAFT_134930 [Pilobolus umbonatus]|nr:hypothetical protein BDB01DRAFT_134930 [Pilobolus umbonatus]